jgi:hypothetical protein
MIGEYNRMSPIM